jgi:hypothetical protein
MYIIYNFSLRPFFCLTNIIIFFSSFFFGLQSRSCRADYAYCSYTVQECNHSLESTQLIDRMSDRHQKLEPFMLSVLSLTLANVANSVKKLPRLLSKPKVHYRVYKSLPILPILSQMHPVHNLLPYFPKMHSDIIFPFTPRSSECSLPFRPSDRNCVCSYHPWYACYIWSP